MVAFSKYFWRNWKNKHFLEFWYFMLWKAQQPSWGLPSDLRSRSGFQKILIRTPPLCSYLLCNTMYSFPKPERKPYFDTPFFCPHASNVRVKLRSVIGLKPHFVCTCLKCACQSTQFGTVKLRPFTGLGLFSSLWCGPQCTHCQNGEKNTQSLFFTQEKLFLLVLPKSFTWETKKVSPAFFYCPNRKLL